MKGGDLPKRIDHAGTSYKLTCFRVVTNDERGRPEECVMIPDERGVELSSGDEFMLCYVPVCMLNLKPGDGK